MLLFSELVVSYMETGKDCMSNLLTLTVTISVINKYVYASFPMLKS